MKWSLGFYIRRAKVIAKDCESKYWIKWYDCTLLTYTRFELKFSHTVRIAKRGKATKITNMYYGIIDPTEYCTFQKHNAQAQRVEPSIQRGKKERKRERERGREKEGESRIYKKILSNILPFCCLTTKRILKTQLIFPHITSPRIHYLTFKTCLTERTTLWALGNTRSSIFFA